MRTDQPQHPPEGGSLRERPMFGLAQDEYQRELWRFCVGIIVGRWWGKNAGRPGWINDTADAIRVRLLDAINEVPDLDVLIRKTQPDMMAFKESQRTRAERYRG